MDVPIRIEVKDGRTLVLSWDDGTDGDITADDLRGACPCASCGEPAGRRAIAGALGRADAIRIDDAHLVGAYALGVRFSDGHATGIFPFDVLRALASDRAI